LKRFYWIGAVIGLGGITAVMSVQPQNRRGQQLEMPEAVGYRILLGLGDKQPTVWDGKISVSEGRVVSIQGWRFAETDSTDYRKRWKASTRHGVPTAAARQRGQKRGAIEENGVTVEVTAKSANTRFDVETAQGDFSFALGDVPYGETKTFLDGRVSVDRVPSTLQLTTSDEEQDFPAIAQSDEEVYVAYVDFVHGDRSQGWPRQMKEEPKSFDALARPAGGDQVRLLRYSKTKRTWNGPEEVTTPGQDCMRTAVAVDGGKRVWVIWSAYSEGNFDLFAKSYSDGKWSSQKRLTTDAGNDINPVATTDSQGRVWVAWQGARKGNLEVLVKAQQGDGFSAEMPVSFSAASDWDPAIAAGPNGEVAVSWDTHDKGDYDVYFRRMRLEGGIRMQAPTAVAASPFFEARSSIAYDPQGRVWVAYEAAGVKWGKDFGAYETTGVALYQGHNLRLKCFQGEKAFETAGDLREALAGPWGARRARRQARQISGIDPMQPNPELAAKRAPSATPQALAPPMPRNSFPRLAVDASGTVFLACRTSTGVRSPVGTVWTGQVAYFDGEKWNGPIDVPHADGLLDNRPALAALGPGHLLMVGASDHRQSLVPGGGRRGDESVNADLYAAEFRLDSKAVAAKLKGVGAEKAAPPNPEVKPELEQVTLMRNYRASIAGRTYRLLRGEFHRHTEISGDGGGDGPLIDAYRYLIDSAYMDWGGCCDHDNGGGREYFWWLNQKLTDAYMIEGRYIPMFSYERSVRYPEGHRNVVFARRGVRPLPRLPKVPDEAPEAPAPDTQMLYRYLRRFDGIAAVHTSGTNMGTDWRDNDPIVEPVVEIYQGDRQNYEMPGAPRTNTENDSIGGWRPLGFVSRALEKGYRLGFQASSDHISTHMSYCNLWVSEPTREAIMEAFGKRRVYGATDNILADVRCGGHFMGEEFAVSEPPSISVKLWGTANFAKVHIIKDNQYVYTAEPGTRKVDFVWKDSSAAKGKTSYYYVRGEQADGELVWVSPMWITYR